MTDRKIHQLVTKLKHEIQKGFGKKVCKELHFDCPSCQAQALIGYLNWYMEILEWPEESQQKKKIKH